MAWSNEINHGSEIKIQVKKEVERNTWGIIWRGLIWYRVENNLGDGPKWILK